MSKIIKTTCPYCGVGCGVLASVENDGRATIKGDPEHPANYGRLCSKGSALADTIDLDERLLTPVVNGYSSDWEDSLNLVASKFNDIIHQHGPDSVAFYVSGQLLTEDYYVANKLMKGYLGSANIDTNSRLCMSSSVVGHKRAFGTDTVPCSYDDLERAKLIVLAGSNTAWCHPVLYQRITKAKEDNPDLMIVVIDPRNTATTGVADIHIGLKPGSDIALFNGLFVYLHQQDEIDRAFIKNSTQGMELALEYAKQTAPDLHSVSELCGVNVELIEKFYRLFSRTERVVTVYSQGINQSSYGSDKVNSIINCHLLTGRIGRPGMGPFSFTGQPNAMGGREVGGLANQLAAHMEIDNEQHRELVKDFWCSPMIANKEGHKAVELFERINRGDIKALWVMGTNPAVSLPNSNNVREALNKCEFVVVSDVMLNTDTTRYADVLLPALAWGEKSGTVTNSERRISRQRAWLPPPGVARPDWWIISQVARRMGFAKSFTYEHPVEIFREHATLSGWKNHGERAFDISYLKDIALHKYDELSPTQWPIHDKARSGTDRMFENGRFYTDSGKARFIPIQNHQPVNSVTELYPLVLNTGRIRDQWHTMTRTGKAARLFRHINEPYAELHPDDALTYQVEEGSLILVKSKWGEIILRCRVSDAQRRGSIFVPMHWNDQFASLACVDTVVNPNTDPYSGQPEFKHTPVSISPYHPAWQGFILSRRKLPMQMGRYWSLSLGEGLYQYEVTGESSIHDWARQARELLCASEHNVEWIEYLDQSASRYRAARLISGKVESAIFISPDLRLPSRDWLVTLFGRPYLDDHERRAILSGQAINPEAESGRTICACFGIGEKVIQHAINSDGLDSVEAIGKHLKAGTNCGSCIPEIKGLFDQESIKVS
ncbi:MAG: molybdopterin-dependent oxidoreductase [Gammaproteobacteria bacterium]|nr:molybdopterin-dependent oxidoreductase [Gammaproteobacteria bacterium]